MSFIKVSKACLPLPPKNQHMLTRQILIGQSFVKPFKATGNKTLLGKGEEFVSTQYYTERTYGRTQIRAMMS